MDAEKFDKVVLDLLYDELDELTRASAVRHMEQSARAKALYSELRATREVGLLPLVEPPPGLTERILLAEEKARAGRPLGQRIGALVSIVAGYSMRPQLAMAALLLLMVGSSLLFLRVKPGEPSSLLVTERGVPESDKESVAILPVSPAPAGEAPGAQGGAQRGRRAAEPSRERPGDRAGEASAAKRDQTALAEAEPGPSVTGATAELGRAAGAPASRGALADADEAKKGAKQKDASCTANLDQYEAVAANPSAPGRSEALWSAAQCYEAEGRLSFARQAYESLLAYPAYSDRARSALSRIPEAIARAPRSAPSSTEPPTAKAAPAKPAAPPPAAASEQ